MPATCLITSGLTADCSNAVGGIQAIWLADYLDLIADSTTVVAARVISVVPATTVYGYSFRPENAGLDISIMTDATQGTTHHEQTLSARFNFVDNDLLDKFTKIAYARPVIFAQDRNEQVFVLGARNGCTITDARSSVGRAFADGNGLDVTFTARENETYFCAASSGPGTAGYPFDGVTGITVA